MVDTKINSLDDLRAYRSAPNLNNAQKKALFYELSKYIENTDWLTIGIMAASTNDAILILREIEHHWNWSPMKVASKPNGSGPVFLKANQKTGDIHIRIEHGLGEGILLGCHHLKEGQDVDMLGPLPLNFFKSKN